MNEQDIPEFRTVVMEDGSIRIPSSYLSRHGFDRGTNVTIRVTELVLTEAMREKGITESEVEAIGRTQLEVREHVLAFLSAEGSISRTSDLSERLRRKG